MEDLTGRQLGPYQVVAPLGEGGMAAVYKAYQPGMDRDVALKILPRHFSSDPQFVGRFRQEARVLARLLHPHILPVFDFGEADGYTYIVMPFVEGGTLAGRLHGRPLAAEDIRRIISQVGDALDYAHSRGFVHRDVKPSNILIDERGNCLLSDFGIAKIVEAQTHLTLTGAAVGTPAYMSPEQGLGQPVDARSDIYALGAVLYELATGRVPYQAETPMAVVFKHIHDPLPLPRTYNPELPKSVEGVVLNALAKRPEDRFSTASDMVQALQAAIPGAASINLPPAKETATPTESAGRMEDTAEANRPTEKLEVEQPVEEKEVEQGTIPSPRPPITKRRRVQPIVEGLIGVLILGVAFTLTRGLFPDGGTSGTPVITATQSPGTSPPTPSPAQPTSMPATNTPPVPTVPSPPPTPSGPAEPFGKIVFTCNVAGVDQICLMDADGSDESQLTDATLTSFYASLSPDGRAILFSSLRESGSELYRMDTDGGNLRRLTFNPGDSYAPSLSPDGAKIVYTYAPDPQDQDIWMMQADGSSPKALIDTDGVNQDPEWSPDGQQIVFASDRNGTKELYVMNADGSRVTQITFDIDIGGRSDWLPNGRTLTFYAGPPGKEEIYLIDVDGQNLHQLTSGGSNTGPTSSPDGQWVAYTSKMDGDYEIFVIRIDGTGMRQLTFNDRADWQPRWGP